MASVLDKLDFELRRLYTRYLESVADSSTGPGRADSSHSYQLVLRYSGDLSRIEAQGFTTIWSEVKGFAHGVVRFDDLERIVSDPHVLSLEYGNKMRPHLNKSVLDIFARSESVIDGIWSIDPATGAFDPASKATGVGVIIGIIDSGIDVTHPVFMNNLAPLDTRILSIWDQGLEPEAGETGPELNKPTYGVEFNKAAIKDFLDQGSGKFRHQDSDDGHGTHVAAIAAGNGNHGLRPPILDIPNFDFVGVAPQADIVVVKYLDVRSDITDTAGNGVGEGVRFIDAIKYILKVASGATARDRKPAVINCSFGNSIGPHDGLTDDEQILDGLFGAEGSYNVGNIVVIAAGNEAGSRQHAEITIPADGEIVVPFELVVPSEYSSVSAYLFVNLWYQEVSAPNIDVSAAVRIPGKAFSAPVRAGEPDIDNASERWSLSHKAETAVNRPDAGDPDIRIRVQRNKISLTVTPNPASTPGEYLPGSYEIQIKGPEGTVLHAWVSQEYGQPKFQIGQSVDLWETTSYGLREVKVKQAGQFNVGDLVSLELVDGTQHQTTISAITPPQQFRPEILELATALPATAKTRVGKVQAGVNIDNKYLINSNGGAKNVITVASYDDNNGNSQALPYGAIATTSSRGPLADYSGLGPYANKPDIAAPGVAIKAALSYAAQDTLLGPSWSELVGNRFVEKGGTSIATPHITGVIALMLQKNPNLSVDEVKEIFANTAIDGTRPGTANAEEHKLAYGSGRVDAFAAYEAVPPRQ